MAVLNGYLSKVHVVVIDEVPGQVNAGVRLSGSEFRFTTGDLDELLVSCNVSWEFRRNK